MKKISQSNIRFERGRTFHNFVVGLDRLDLVPGPAWMAAALALAWTASRAWPAAHAAVFILTAAPLVLEAAVLLWLSRSGRTPGPFGGPFFLFMVGHLAPAWVVGHAPAPLWLLLAVHVAIQAGLLSAMAYASAVAPFAVRFREFEVKGRGSNPSGGTDPIKLLLIGDLHLDRWGEREDKILEMARSYRPDLILFPGDFTNLSFVGDRRTEDQAVRFINELCALAPVYATRGSVEVDPYWWVAGIIGRTGAVLLEDSEDTVTVRGRKLRLIGVSFDWDWTGPMERLARMAAAGGATPIVLLYHSPDLFPLAARLGIDLYVAGHTHGGQIRLPLIGAPYTSSRFGQRFAQGMHEAGLTTMVVSRGIGMEGGGAPRMRFMAGPEVVGIDYEV